jgi:S1-C subfamily serine protease
MGLTDCSPAGRANQFHSGTTCPACQETIEMGQSIVSCRKCAAIHHETCWHHAAGCSAYACSSTVQRDPEQMSPELVITAADADRAAPPPVRQRSWVRQPLEHHLPPPATRRSVAGLVACGLTAISCLLLIGGVVLHQVHLLLAGIVSGMGALVFGLVSLVAITNGTRVYGRGVAAASIVVSSCLLLMTILSVGRIGITSREQHQVRLTANRSMPSEQALLQMPESKARAMRANTVITSSTGLFSSFGVGSGIIVQCSDHAVHVLTNKHVVEMGGEKGVLHVLFHNGEESEATVAWLAPGDVDLAILRCEALTLAADVAVWPAATPPAQGEHVFAVGNPMALYWSYTEGVISAIREQSVGEREITVYQTQTPINQGNSGGGLYNMRGELVGINTWTQDKAFAEGLSFAISAQSMVDLLRADQKIGLIAEGETGSGTDSEGATR